MWMAGVAAVALIVGALLSWWMVDQAKAQPVRGEAEERPVLFLGNGSLPPMNFIKNGKPTGIVLDLAEALAKRMRHPVEIRLMNWTEAQQLVLQGRADALLQINPNLERLKVYDFSEPLLNSEFTIFTSAQRPGIASIRDLRGLKVGVEEKGLPILLLQEDPQIIVKIIPDFVQGFRMLATGALDALVADRRVGSYVLAENDIGGVKLIEEPIGRSHSAIAVKKGNTNLLGDINSALADIRQDGTYDRIIQSWQPKEVVFKTREQLHQQAWLITAISVALIVALVGVAALVWQIRRRKSVEATLRESEVRYRTMFDSMTEGFALHEILTDDQDRPIDYRFVDVNPAFETLTGLKRADLVGRCVREVLPDIESYWIDSYGKVALTGESLHFENFSATLDRWYEIFAYRTAPGHFAVVFTDITARKQMEETIHKAKEEAEKHAKELESLMDAVPALIWISRDTECLSMTGNRAVYEFLRMPIGANVSKTAPEAARPVHFKALRDGMEIPLDELPMQQAAKGKGMQDYELEYVFDDGTSKITLGNTRPLYDVTGQAYGAIAAFVDITERKRVEELLRKSKDELESSVQKRTTELRVSNKALMEYAAKLERLNEELQEFSFVASHDLQEPLRKIQTFGHMLSQKYQENLDEQGQDYLCRITRSAKRMSDLLRSLLDYSRIASRPSPFEPVSLAELTREAVSDLGLVINQAGGTIEIGDLPPIDADAVQIRQLLQNLIANSIKYCKDSEKPVVRVYGHSSGTICTIFVEDNGIGFEEEYADRIFRPFQQLHGRSEYEGLGMGLAICRKIVEHHGGSITAKSMLGQGATFIVQLPVKQR